MKKLNSYYRKMFGKTPLDLIRDNIPQGSKLKQMASSGAGYSTIGDVRIVSFPSGVHQIYAGKKGDHMNVLTFVDGRTGDQKLENAGYEKMDSCFVRQTGENHDFSELNFMLDKYLPQIPVVRLEQVTENTFLASLFYTPDKVKNRK